MMVQRHGGFTSELKFVITAETASAVREWARSELKADPNASGISGDGYNTTSIYFDTENFDLFFRRGSHARAKYRIRAYSTGAVFLERKMKAGSTVYKRRSDVTLDELARIADPRIDWTGRWFARRLHKRGLKPVCQIGYSRTARVGLSSDGPLRLTIDQDLAAVAVDRIAFTEREGITVLPDQAILELKYRGTLPDLFDRLVEEFQLKPRTLSKYRLCVRTLGLTDEKESILLLV
jgi:hypothetical protein